MFRYNPIIIILLTFLLQNCGKPKATIEENFTIKTNLKDSKMVLGDTLQLGINNLKKHDITSVTYKLGDKVIEKVQVIDDALLGVQTITANVTFDETTEEVSKDITIFNNKKPKIYNYKIINEYPHDITSYTQGLEFHNGILYESTGQYEESKLRKVNYETGEVLKNINLSSQYFGEGITIMGNKLYQLTWKENTAFVYDLESFEKLESFKYGESKEGWGLCNDGKNLYKSDGTDKIWTLDPKDFTEHGYIQVYTDAGKIPSLNELEWIDGKIYANIYHRNGIVIINPKNGAVEGILDFSSLQEKVKQHPTLDVLNGIAYNPATKTIFVTGKDWDKLFEVEIIEE